MHYNIHADVCATQDQGLVAEAVNNVIQLPEFCEMSFRLGMQQVSADDFNTWLQSEIDSQIELLGESA